MANDLTVRPIKVDTAMGSTYNTAQGRNGVTVRKVRWVAPTTLAHTFNINDAAGKSILAGSASAADVSGTQNIDFDTPVRWKDFQVSQISSGVLYIHCD